ncbi:hypothetical protein SAMN05444159_6982 [Bradyrhizobium lablabi]|uniref:SulA-family protein n=1 Tax=Bradyrhizobium lablabi TaxID=722472 RepID=A0A1M7DZJ5_9BRAD|nr:TIGR01777 family oxidoreductase [Bradyrhizobium lablabi]SHL84877.1 hypothetical protein SAMN05444159_6982 [Bradyrhizobium lablabi]
MTSPYLWTLIAIQIAMGAFDTLYHHEMTERLAWRPSQRHELQLHSVRNALYALLFLTLGWLEVHGIWAILVIAVLVVEVVITLMDFVEEDMSRKLPASERINHTLLALNYGAILVLLLPILIEWAGDASAVKPAYHGFWSILAAVSAIGVGVSGLRDFAASKRLARMTHAPAGGLAKELSGRQTVMVTGATGFIGSRLVAGLTEAGHQVIALVRNPAKIDLLHPPITLITSLDQLPPDAKIDAIVNLAGEPIGNGLWTEAKRRKMIDSRIGMTEDIVRLIARLERRPAVLVNGSAIGWYGLWQDQPLTESAKAHACFSHELCDAWEKAASRAAEHGVRVVYLRIGLVVGTEGGLLTRMLTPFEFGLGGPIGSGQQWMSWIERDDLIRLIVHAVARPDINGPINATAPIPVRNMKFTEELGHRLGRPAIFRVPGTLLHYLAGDFADELLLGGQRVIPNKALSSGFVFRHETLRSAFEAIL